jgi:hypothetical protein
VPPEVVLLNFVVGAALLAVAALAASAMIPPFYDAPMPAES